MQQWQNRLQSWPALVITAGCLVAMLGFGPRASLGLFLPAMSAEMPWGRDAFAFAVALQNLLWGLGQPFAGAIADKFGASRVLAVGGVFYGLGLIGMPYAQSIPMLNGTAGFLIGLGLAGCSFNLVLGAFAKILPEEKRPLAFGLGTAAGSFGQFLYAPMAVYLMGATSWQTTLSVWGWSFLLVLPLSLLLATKPAANTGSEVTEGLKSILKRAAAHRSYQLLVAGFFVCGFHIAFITVHLPAYLNDKGLSPAIGGKVLAAIGLFNILGCLMVGWMMPRYPKRWLLSAIYGIRSLAIIAFLLTPVSPSSALLFGASIGFLWLSTVPPTSALVGVMFGTRYLSTLYGVVFLSHQLGAFLGVWLGGWLYVTTGSYNVIWWIAVALGVFAALIHLPIKERSAALVPAM